VPNEPPRLSIEAAAKFLAEYCFTNEYRKTCIAHWRGLYGDEYADAVRKRALALLKPKDRENQ
jgi:hypothetical protein